MPLSAKYKITNQHKQQINRQYQKCSRAVSAPAAQRGSETVQDEVRPAMSEYRRVKMHQMKLSEVQLINNSILINTFKYRL